MANTSSIDVMNTLLNDVLFQVVGSTPRNVMTTIKKAGLSGDRAKGVRIATIAVYAAAVNKSTLETFIADAKFQDVRATIFSAFSLSGRINMTALTLLGHCLMTADEMDGVKFVAEFRNKMGQNNIWAGNLESGSLGQKQRDILKEKKRLTDAGEAALLGRGFFKYIGLNSTAMTGAELDFWEMTDHVSSNTTAEASSRVQQSVQSPERSSNRQRFRTPSLVDIPQNVQVNVGSSKSVEVPKDVVDYYLSLPNNTDETMAASIEKRGLDGFIQAYRSAMSQGYGGTGTIVR